MLLFSYYRRILQENSPIYCFQFFYFIETTEVLLVEYKNTHYQTKNVNIEITFECIEIVKNKEQLACTVNVPFLLKNHQWY